MILPNSVGLEAVHAGLVVKNAHLELQQVMFHVAGGAVSGQARLDTPHGKTPSLAVKLEGKGISLEQLASEAGRAKQISGGRTDFAIDLSGAGHSLHDLLADASGELRIVVGPAMLSDKLRDAGGDAWAKLADTLGSLQQTDKSTNLACAVARLPIQKGLITVKRSIAYETTEVNVVIAGIINLSDESLALVMRPAFKQGFDIGSGKLAKMVHVEGTLTNPSIGLDAMGVWRQLLSLYAAFATSGASLLVEEVLKRPVDPHPCQSALATSASKPVGKSPR